MRLLLIEDDSMLGRALLVGLRQDGHATDWVQTAADAHSAWLAPQPSIVPYEAIVLDLGLPTAADSTCCARRAHVDFERRC